MLDIILYTYSISGGLPVLVLLLSYLENISNTLLSDDEESIEPIFNLDPLSMYASNNDTVLTICEFNTSYLFVYL